MTTGLWPVISRERLEREINKATLATHFVLLHFPCDPYMIDNTNELMNIVAKTNYLCSTESACAFTIIPTAFQIPQAPSHLKMPFTTASHL